MKSMFAAAAALSLFAFTGCNTGTPGGPGTKDKDKTTATKDKGTGTTLGTAENTFKLTVPTLSTKLKQGETKDIQIGISRGKNFDQDVALKFENTPKGVTFDPAAPMIKKGDKNVDVKVKASDDATPNDFTIKVVGHPETGDDATHDLKITVASKK